MGGIRGNEKTIMVLEYARSHFQQDSNPIMPNTLGMDAEAEGGI
jgi:hypothetical protein